MKESVGGWFVYQEANDGWKNGFTVEDDDGMTFVLDKFKQFHGRPVRITVETDDTLQPTWGDTSYVAQMTGLTCENTRPQRDAEREAMLHPPSLDPQP